MKHCFTLLFSLCLVSHQAFAQSDLPNGVSLELNTVEASDNACTLTFLITNNYPDAIEKLIYETVLFDQSGQVDRLTLFDFGMLPSGTPRVRQFAVPETTCSALGQILFNGLDTCEAANLSKEDCAKGLRLNSRTDIEVLG